jgi:hypothetical protein
LTYLINLKILKLSFNYINKIEGLDNCIKLEFLDLHENIEIEKIEGLDNCINLEKLYLYLNNIFCIENIDSLKNLKEFKIWDNPLTYSKYKKLPFKNTGIPPSKLKEIWDNYYKTSEQKIIDDEKKRKKENNRLKRLDKKLELEKIKKESLKNFNIKKESLKEEEYQIFIF